MSSSCSRAGDGCGLERVPHGGGAGAGADTVHPQGGQQAVGEVERPDRTIRPVAAQARRQLSGEY